jgi:hydrogenase/urease accessory protein HupE
MSVGAFASGFFQPLLLPAHALLLLALGLLLGQQGRWVVPALAFAVALTAGLAAIALAVGQTPAGDVVLTAVAAIGVLVALARPLPAIVCAALAAIAGIALGLDSPPQAISIASATMMLIGTGLGACVMLVIVAFGTRSLRRDWQRIGARILGSWIAASAILVLALRFSRGLLL